MLLTASIAKSQSSTAPPPVTSFVMLNVQRTPPVLEREDGRRALRAGEADRQGPQASDGAHVDCCLCGGRDEGCLEG